MTFGGRWRSPPRELPEAAGLDAASVQAVEGMAAAFAGSSLCRRLAAAERTAREQRFAFALDGAMITGVFDVVAEEPGGRLLVVDYKSDRLARGEHPEDRVAAAYGLQRAIYALAALRTGAAEVEVVHAFLERRRAARGGSLHRRRAGPRWSVAWPSPARPCGTGTTA